MSATRFSSLKTAFAAPRAQFLLLLGLFWLVRLLQGASAAISFDEEEGFMAAAAWELIHGHGWPYQAYQLSDWENGTLLTVLLTAPITLLLGPTVAALKVAALAISSLTLCGLYLLCREVAGHRAGLLGGLLFVAFPAPLLHYSLTIHGFHPDSTGLQLLFVWLLLKVLRQGGTDLRRSSFLAGLLGGLAIYFAYISVITVLAGSLVFIWQVVRQHGRKGAGPLLGLVTGGLVGVLPLVAYNAANNSLGLAIHQIRPLTDFLVLNEAGQRWAQFKEETAAALLHFSNFCAPDRGLLTLFNLFFWGAGLAAVLGPLFWRLVRRARPGRGSPYDPRTAALDATVALLSLLSFYVFFSAGHPIFPWHLFPLLVLLLAVIAVRAVRLWASGSRACRLISALMIAPILVFGAVENARLIHPSRLGVSWSLDGRNLPLFLERAETVQKTRGSPGKLDQVRRERASLPLELGKLETVNTGYALGALGPDIIYTEFFGEALVNRVTSGDLSLGGVRRFLESAARGPRRLRALQAAGYCLGLMLRAEHFKMERPPSLAQVVSLISGQHRGAVPHLVEGLGFAFTLPRVLEAGLLPQPGVPSGAGGSAGAGVPGTWLPHLARGLGRAVRVPRLFSLEEPFCASPLPPQLQGPFMEGVGRGMGCRYLGNVPGVVRARVCPARLQDFDRGLSLADPGCRASVGGAS